MNVVFDYELNYFDCQNCDGKIHCKDCSAKVPELLACFEDVAVLEADTVKKVLRLEMPPEREDEVLDLLETWRFFAD